MGIIESIKEIKTKNNELMAFATLEDDFSSIELTLFPRVYKNLANLQTGCIVIVYGLVQLRNKKQLLVDDLQII